VNVFIGRIKAVNPIINCCVDNRFELALEEAKRVDQLIQSGEKDEKTLELETPFLGVPFTIKDCFSVTGKKDMFVKLRVSLKKFMCVCN
jgi:fatty acid amide hydrolase 2